MTESEFIEKYIHRSKLPYRIIRFFLYPLVFILYRPRVINSNFIPREGGVIIAGNHRYLHDPGTIAYSTSRPVRFLAKNVLHKRWYLRWFFELALTIPVNREGESHNSLSAAETALRMGEVIGIFPEGTRNRTSEDLLPFRYGAVKMAAETGVPIVPCAMRGGEYAILRRETIVFGEPYYIAKDADLEAENEKLRRIISDLKKEY